MTFMGGVEGVRDIEAEVTTSGYRVSGIVHTRFDRIAAILNSLDHTHLVLEGVTIRELDDGATSWTAASATVPLDEILFLAASLPGATSMDAIVVPKRPFAATVGLPPFRLAGTMYVPESVESPANVITVNPDAFIVMTDASVTCPAHPALDAVYPVVAFQRRRVHVFSVGIAADGAAAPVGDDPRAAIDWG
jgi:hypothetical protein